MIPIQCRTCGHFQDAGSALAPNDVCERCGTAIYGPKSWNPTTMAAFAALVLIGAALIGMPLSFLAVLSALLLLFTVNALVQKKVRPAGQQARCDDCGRSMTISSGSGPGMIMLSREEAEIGIGPAEICTACHRVWCASCFPSRPKNSCPCGQRRDSYEVVGGATYLGPVRLVKALYHQLPPFDAGSLT